MIEVRPALESDLAAIMAIETATFGLDAWLPETMAGELADIHSTYLVATAADRVIGYAGLRAPVGSGSADVQTIAVAAVERGAGVGRMLLGELLRQAERLGASEIFLEVRADNPIARGMYERHGFEQISIRPHYYRSDGVDAIVMRLRPDPRAAIPELLDVIDPNGAKGPEEQA